MSKHRWSILCSSASVDASTNLLSLFNIIEEVKVGGLPPVLAGTDVVVVPIPMTLVTMWSRDDADQPEDTEGQVSILDPQDRELLTTPTQKVDLRSHATVRAMSQFVAFPVRGFGIYHLVVRFRQYSQQGSAAGEWAVADRVPFKIAAA
jgi:hypothetical protein